MTITNFIGELWAAQLLQGTRKNLVYSAISNSNYQGVVNQKGDVVHINSIADITISDYTKGSDMSEPQSLTDADTELRITQQKSFAFAVEDLDVAQAAGNFDSTARSKAEYALADTRDQYIASLYTDASGDNLNGSDASPVTPNLTQGDASNIFNVIADCGRMLTDSAVPKQGRIMIVPPWFATMIAKDLKVSVGAASLPAASDSVLNGYIGHVAGFDILESQNTPNTSGTLYKVLFGTNQAITFADSIRKVEAIRDPDQFRDIVRGLDVYGAKVVEPDYLGVLTCNSS